MFHMENMVTVELLQKSQPTRPRKWIPVACFIMLILTLAVTAAMALFLFPNLGISKMILGKIPDKALNIGMIDSLYKLIGFVIIPAAAAFVNLFALIFSIKMCKYRRAYWWFGWILIVAYVVMVLLTVLFVLYYMVPFLTNLINKIPANILNLLEKAFRFGTAGYGALFALVMLFGLFYNVNYPAKYEEIYTLRKQRIKSFRDGSDRSAYRKRFYKDYKKGNWTSMMLDLHYKAFIPDSMEPMRRDSYEFMVAYCCERDATLKRAVFDQYAKEGRFLECRRIYQDIKDKSDIIEEGGKVVIPHYIPEPAVKTRKIRIPKRPVVVKPQPPLAPAKSATNPKSRKWSPEDI